MTDEQIEELRKLIESGATVHYLFNDLEYRQIVKIGSSPSQVEGDENWEPGPVGYFPDRRYVALWDCEPGNLFKVEKIFLEVVST